MNDLSIPVWRGKAVKWLFFLLALTGAAQMPIFKRYYVADLPGLGWLADFYLTNVLHYVLGAVFLFFVFMIAAEYLRFGRDRLAISLTGWIRIGLVGLIVVTGLFRVLKNEPDISFSPFAVVVIDWTHLFAALMLGLAALAAFFSGRGSYFRVRSNRQ